MYDGDGHVVARHGQADPTERDDDGRNLTDRQNPGHRRRQGENHRREFVVRLKYYLRSNLPDFARYLAYLVYRVMVNSFLLYKIRLNSDNHEDLIMKWSYSYNHILFVTYRTRAHIGSLRQSRYISSCQCPHL